MKRVFLFFISVLFISCQDEWDLQPEDDRPVVFRYAIESEGLPTRFAGSNFEAGDDVSIYMIPHQANGNANLTAAYAGAANVHYKIDGASNLVSTGKIIKYPSDGSPVNFVAYFPYNPGATLNHKVPVDVRQVNYPLTDMGLLYYNGVGIAKKKNDAIDLNYQSQLSKLTIIVKPEKGYDVDLSARSELSITGMPVTADFNLSTGKMENPGGTADTVRLVLMENSTRTEARWEALIIPHTKTDAHANGRIFTFSFGNEKRYFPLPDDVDFVKGKSYTFNFKLLKDYITPQPETTTPDRMTNSYIVMPGKEVKFKVSRAYKYNGTNFTHTLRVGGEYTDKFGVDVVWEDASIIDRAGTKVDGSGKEAVVTVKTLDVFDGGNAVVKIYRKDTNEIVWSYHIWMPQKGDDPTLNTYIDNGFTFMDRNLGATFAGTGRGWGTGLFYQWGRKDPFPATGKPDNPPKGDGLFTTVNTSDELGTVENTIKNPGVFYCGTAETAFDWHKKPHNDELWGPTGDKTIYDPCPAGWRVPKSAEKNPWEDFIKYSVWENNGRKWKEKGAYYPAASHRSFATASLMSDAKEGYYWTANTTNTNNGKWLKFSENSAGGIDGQGQVKAMAASIRCVKEL
jgi:uncharacterized protein (TIGR02145 family)